jgi:putative effector of murein hydrolase LrgA (UPF0299 family)
MRALGLMMAFFLEGVLIDVIALSLDMTEEEMKIFVVMMSLLFTPLTLGVYYYFGKSNVTILKTEEEKEEETILIKPLYNIF